jgi:hypothetical protein
VRFVASREELSPDTPLTEWRAVKIDGAPLEQVMDLLGKVVRDYESGSWGPGHRDHPDGGVKLLMSPDLEPVRAALEAAVTDAGLVVVPSTDWELRAAAIGGGRGDLSDVEIKVRHHPDRTPNPVELAKGALPAVAGLAGARSVSPWGVRIVLSIALPADGHLRYVFVLGTGIRTGLRYENLPEAIAAFRPISATAAPSTCGAPTAGTTAEARRGVFLTGTGFQLSRRIDADFREPIGLASQQWR